MSFTETKKRLDKIKSKALRLSFNTSAAEAYTTRALEYQNGCPLGGVGTGTFSRNSGGDFNIWHNKIGINKQYRDSGIGFFIKVDNSIWSLGSNRKIESLTRKNVDFFSRADADVYFLYPKSWYHYHRENFPCEIICEQFSPVTDGNYCESTFPTVVFKYYIKNRSNKTVKIDLVFSMLNMLGCFQDFSCNITPFCNEGNFNTLVRGSNYVAVKFQNKYHSAIKEGYGENAIGVQADDNVQLSGINQFLLTDFVQESGVFGNSEDHYDLLGSCFDDYEDKKNSWISKAQRPIYGALKSSCTLKENEETAIIFSYVWDNPIVEFGSGRKWYKYYTKYFGKSGSNSLALLEKTFEKHHLWSDSIEKEFSQFDNIPCSDTIKGLLVNEKYFLIHGGTFLSNEVVFPDKNCNNSLHFGVLEGFDFGYHYYNTIGLVYHAAFALAKTYPLFLKAIIDDFITSIIIDDQENMKILATNDITKRKPLGIIPHDQDTMYGDPFIRYNGYETNSDSSKWKDQYSAFILTLFAYVKIARPQKTYLEEIWPTLLFGFKTFKEQFCNYRDILPSHDAPRDNNWDALHFHGVSSYLANMYLASIIALREFAKTVEDKKMVSQFQAILDEGRQIIEEKLVRDDRILIDSDGDDPARIFIDQCSGDWMLYLLDEETVFSESRLKTILHFLYEENFVNKPYGPVMINNSKGIQSDECLLGMGYLFATFLMKMGENKKAEFIFNKMKESIDEKGLYFMTPAAIGADGLYRAPYNLRPLAIYGLTCCKI